jgi:hypothetical protein
MKQQKPWGIIKSKPNATQDPRQTNRENHHRSFALFSKKHSSASKEPRNSNHAFAIQNKRKVEIHKEILLE